MAIRPVCAVKDINEKRLVTVEQNLTNPTQAFLYDLDHPS
jgi:hypothetical protein